MKDPEQSDVGLVILLAIGAAAVTGVLLVALVVREVARWAVGT